MADRSLARFVVYVVVEALIVLSAIAVILAFLSPITGLSWALALVLFVVLVAIIFALLIYPRTAAAAPATLPIEPSKRPAVGLTAAKVEPATIRSPEWEKQLATTPPPLKLPAPPTKSPAPAPATVTPRRWGQAYLNAQMKPRLAVLSGLQPATSSRAQPPTVPPPRAFKEGQLGVPKVIEVHDVAFVRLPLKKGDELYGLLGEEDGLDFSWSIVDHENLGLMERGEEYEQEDGEEDVPSATIKWTAPSDGPWYLAFDAYRKQYVRKVELDLWRRYLIS